MLPTGAQDIVRWRKECSAKSDAEIVLTQAESSEYNEEEIMASKSGIFWYFFSATLLSFFTLAFLVSGNVWRALIVMGDSWLTLLGACISVGCLFTLVLSRR